VKTFNLVPSAQKNNTNGRHVGVRSRTITRKDVLPEINFVIQGRISTVLLTIVNLRNNVAEHIVIFAYKDWEHEEFQSYSTSQALNDENGQNTLH